MMEILYISSATSQKQSKYLASMVKKSFNIAVYGTREAGVKFHSLVQRGLVGNKCHVTSLVGRPVGRGYKGVFWQKQTERTQGIHYIHLGIINLPIIKQAGITVSMFINTLLWGFRVKNDKAIIIDASYITVLPFVTIAAKLTKTKIIALVADIYDYMSVEVEDALSRGSRTHRIIARVLRFFYGRQHGYIFLTEAMNSVINQRNKPFLVMEGLVDIRESGHHKKRRPVKRQRAVMYAGSLIAAYGARNLLKGFDNFNDSGVELWVYGAGAYAKQVEKAAAKDPRVKFYGMVPIEEVVRREKEATILINPRPVGQEFTKYSFPSKIMEYMVSGTAVMSTKLPGMPTDYYPYILMIDGDAPEDISNALNDALSLPPKELEKLGKKARNYVLKYKNNISQAKRIKDFIKQC
jgi:glycosyltransferase involved in cell wall biosynthesis